MSISNASNRVIQCAAHTEVRHFEESCNQLLVMEVDGQILKLGSDDQFGIGFTNHIQYESFGLVT
jgi:hypothetical protein